MTKIAIVGAGVSGLSAGIYALKKGYEVSIYERHYKAGGNLTGWDRQGYHIDNCIHWLTGTNPNTKLYKMWLELGVLGDIEIYQGETLFTYKEKDITVSLFSDLNKTRDNMLSISPEDKKEILSFIKAIEVIQKIDGIYGNESDKAGNFIDKIFQYPHLLKYYFLSTGDLAKKFKSPILKKFICSVMGECFSSLALIIVFATFTGKNGGIPKGSSQAMAKRMENKFTSMGGKLHLKKGVNKINVEDNRAVSLILDNEEEVFFDYVVISGDPKYIFTNLLDASYMPSPLKKHYDDLNMIRFSAYHCAYSCDLSKLDFNGDVILEVPKKYQDKLPNNYIMIREFQHEKDFAPNGKNIIQVMVYCNENDSKKFIELSKNEKEYVRLKQEISEIIKEIIYEEFNILKGKLKTIDIWTPATYKRYTDSDIGSFMSFVLPPKVIPKTITNKVKGLNNVILASQWLQAPGGLPIAARVGKNATETISDLIS